MASFNFDFTEITFTALKEEVNIYLQRLYKKAGQMFSPASPYGHILQALEMIFQLQMTYQKNTVNQFDLSNTDNQNRRTIRSLSIIGGHNPIRAQSANGTLRLQVRSGITISQQIPGSKVTFMNKSRIRNRSNNLDYFLDLGKDFITFIVEPGTDFFLPITQGLIRTQTFTGTGAMNQSFSVVVPTPQDAENNRVVARVDGSVWTKRDHLYDMLPLEQAYTTKTGFNGGLEVWFGNENFGKAPQIGDQIEVEYVVTNGADGNVLNSVDNDWSFIDEVYDAFGGLVDVSENFFIFIEDEINFGANGESIEFTKSIMPFISRNFVLARPEQFMFVLKRLNIFSQINAYTTEKGTQFDNQDPMDDSIVYLFLVPDFTIYLRNNDTANYFNLNLDAFYLDGNEQTKIIQYLNTQGIIGVGIGVKILQPVISRYVLNILLYIYQDATEKTVREEILEALSVYFTNLQRRDRIPKSDLIRVIEGVEGVDSVSVKIVSEKNEIYHGAYVEYVESIMLGDPNANPDDIVMEGYDPDLILGLDADTNDIIIEKDELALVRGGWSDRYRNVYDSVPKTRGLSSVNFVFKGVTKRLINT